MNTILSYIPAAFMVWMLLTHLAFAAHQLKFSRKPYQFYAITFIYALTGPIIMLTYAAISILVGNYV